MPISLGLSTWNKTVTNFSASTNENCRIKYIYEAVERIFNQINVICMNVMKQEMVTFVKFQFGDFFQKQWFYHSYTGSCPRNKIMTSHSGILWISLFWILRGWSVVLLLTHKLTNITILVWPIWWQPKTLKVLDVLNSSIQENIHSEMII